MERKILFSILRKSFSRETCFPALQGAWSKENPTLGHCAIIALIINDFLGGKIMRCMVNGISHYYNLLINNEVIDLTVDQFRGQIPSYESGEERSRDYLLGNADTKSRYEKFQKNIIESKKVENIDFNIFKGKKNIILDLDGTLIDSIAMWNNADVELLTRLGKVPGNIGQERDKFLTENTHSDYLGYAQHVIDSYQIKGISAQEFENLRRDSVKDYQINKLDLKEGAAEFLIMARKRGYLLTLATISTPQSIEIYANENKKIRDKINFYEIFNGGILTNQSVTQKKPKPEVYIKAIELNHNKPEECIVIEDSLSGVQAAKDKAANLETIAIYDKHADCDREEINKLTDYTAPDYETLQKNLRL